MGNTIAGSVFYTKSFRWVGGVLDVHHQSFNTYEEASLFAKNVVAYLINIYDDKLELINRVYHEKYDIHA